MPKIAQPAQTNSLRVFRGGFGHQFENKLIILSFDLEISLRMITYRAYVWSRLTNTDMMKQADPEKLQGRIDNICMGRLAEPEGGAFVGSEPG